ncbi:unnamed protein product [Rhodiola kirilowii]
MLSVIQRRPRLHTSGLHAPNVSLVKVSLLHCQVWHNSL